MNNEELSQVVYKKPPGQLEDLTLVLPQDVALSAAFEVIQTNMSERTGEHIEEGDLFRREADPEMKLSRILYVSIVARLADVDDEQVAQRIGAKDQASLFESIDQAFASESDETIMPHIKDAHTNFIASIHQRLGLKAEYGEAMSTARLAARKISGPNIEDVTKRGLREIVEHYKKTGMEEAYTVIHDRFSKRYGGILYELGEEKGIKLPHWVYLELDTLLREIVNVSDFKIVDNIDEAINEGLSSGLEDSIQYGRPLPVRRKANKTRRPHSNR